MPKGKRQPTADDVNKTVVVKEGEPDPYDIMPNPRSPMQVIPDERVTENARCGARTHKGGKPCQMKAGAHTEHPGIGACRHHGGANPAYMQHLIDTGRVAGFIKYGEPHDVTPVEALSNEIMRSEGHVEWLRSKIADMEMDPHDMPAGHHAWWLNIYQAERAHLARVAKAGADAGVEERRAELTDEVSMIAAGIIRAVLDEVGLTQEQWNIARPAIERHFVRAGRYPEEYRDR